MIYMKKFLVFIFLPICICANAQIEKKIPARPSPPRLVNDFANILTPEQESALENKLVAYDDSTSSQVAIVIVNDLQGYEAVEYAVALGRKWGVGGKEFSNGVVILVSTGGGEGGRDAFIATGYGLEGAIPDITASSIVDNDLIPNFKNGNYYRGFDLAIDDIIKAAAGEYKAPEGYGKKKNKGIGFGAIIFFIILLFLFAGRGGGRGGGMVSRRGYRDIGTGWIIGSLLGGAGRGGGGGWSGGGGGGFGGFGGGGFGGGGAGGKW
jgi:uncharacterized protein